MVNTIEYFSKNLHENRVLFSEERNAFVLDHVAAVTSRANQQVILGIDSLSIRPSLGVRGEEILGRGGRKRESCPLFSLISFAP